jgi:REP element-mobilizing transposase RayT
MGQSLAKIVVHLIFSTKDRLPVLTLAVRGELHVYMVGILRELESPALLVNSVTDHAHILFVLSKNVALAKAVEEVKKGSSKWLKARGAEFGGFHWQSGYGGFSVSESSVEAVKRYIADQEEHHRRKTFQEEFRAFLQRYGVEYDEQYVWD